MADGQGLLRLQGKYGADFLNTIVYAPALDCRFQSFYEEIVSKSKIHLLVTLLKEKRAVSVLDVGGGIGSIGKVLLEKFGDKVHYTNLDCDPLALQLSPGKTIYSDFYFYDPQPIFDYVFMVNTGQDPQYLTSRDGLKYSLGLEFEHEVEKVALFTALKSLRKSGTLMIALFDPTPVNHEKNYIEEVKELYTSLPHLKMEAFGKLNTEQEAIDLYKAIDALERERHQEMVEKWSKPSEAIMESLAVPAKCDPIYIRIKKKQEFSSEFHSYLDSHFKRGYALSLFFLLSAQEQCASDEQVQVCIPGMTKTFLDTFKELSALAKVRGIELQEILKRP